MQKSYKGYVLKFIETNPYCKAEDIVEGIKDRVSRAVVFKILKELVSDNIIADVSDSRRDNKYILNENNEFNIVKRELSDFKKYYYVLLEKSLVHPQIVNALDKINHSLPEIKNEPILLDTYAVALKEYVKAKETRSERKALINRLNNPFFGNKAKKIGEFSSFEGDFAVIRVPKTQLQNGGKNARRNLSFIARINSLSSKYSSHIKKAGYAALTLLPIYLFIILVQFIILKSTSIWPSVINDRDSLFRLNRFVYEEIIEMNSELTKYLSKSNQNLQISKVVELNDYRISQDTDDLVREIYQVYSILNLKTEIKRVLKSFNTIRKKELDYNIEEKVIDIVKENSELALDTKQGIL